MKTNVMLTIAMCMSLSASEDAIDDSFHISNISEFSFCASCSIVRTKSNDLNKWWRYQPKKIYWGSTAGATPNLYIHKNYFDHRGGVVPDCNYLVFLSPRENHSSDTPIFSSIPIQGKLAKLRLTIGREDAIAKWSVLFDYLEHEALTMTQKFPLDDADK